MTKTTTRERSPRERLRLRRNLIRRSLRKHFPPDELKRLQSMSGWSMGATDLTSRDPFLLRIAAVSIRYLPKLTGIRALWEGLDSTDFADDPDVRAQLASYKANLQRHSAYSFLVEYALGNEHKFNIDQALLMLSWEAPSEGTERMVTP